MQKDISGILAGWDHVPDELSVRRIRGIDGRTKIQLRLDLGLLQMEMDGRPDGTRPFGMESLLEYYQALLQQRRAQGALDEEFRLDANDCLLIQQEAIQYYHRYLCLFHLEDFKRATRDTARNLQVFDLVKRYAEEEEQKWALDQYRPYVIMVHTKAKSLVSISEDRHDRAVEQVEEGIALIEEFFEEYGSPDQIETSQEIALLKNWLAEIKRMGAPGVRQRLEEALHRAVEQEAYEKAAELRDRIRRLQRDKSLST
jgi:hypothetical protein